MKQVKTSILENHLSRDVNYPEIVVSIPWRFLNSLTDEICNHRYIDMPEHLKEAIEKEIKMLLHAERDCMRNQGKDATKIKFFSLNDTYFCEAFGMLRTLQTMGYGELGASNARPAEPPNLRAWFERLQDEVLEEEGLHTDNRCRYCLEKYGKDDKSEKETRQRRIPSAIFCGRL